MKFRLRMRLFEIIGRDPSFSCHLPGKIDMHPHSKRVGRGEKETERERWNEYGPIQVKSDKADELRGQ